MLDIIGFFVFNYEFDFFKIDSFVIDVVYIVLKEIEFRFIDILFYW